MQLTANDYQLLSKLERIVIGHTSDDSEKPTTKEQQEKLLIEIHNELSCGLFPALQKMRQLDRLSSLISGSYSFQGLDMVIDELEKGTDFEDIKIEGNDGLTLWAGVEDSITTPDELLGAV